MSYNPSSNPFSCAGIGLGLQVPRDKGVGAEEAKLALPFMHQSFTLATILAASYATDPILTSLLPIHTGHQLFVNIV